MWRSSLCLIVALSACDTLSFEDAGTRWVEEREKEEMQLGRP